MQPPPSPLNAALVRAALQEISQNPARQLAAWDNIAHAHAEAARLCGISGLASQILPVVLRGRQTLHGRGRGIAGTGF